MQRRWMIGLGVGIVLAAAWYLFRPELLFVNQRVNEAFPVVSAASRPETSVSAKLAEGTFHGVAHAGKGTASLHQWPDGRRVLRLSGFETSNGPALHVYLIAAADAVDNDAVTRNGYLDLGPLKGNVGDQNYDVPADADLSKYRAVTVWCSRFKVNFTTAPLQMVNAAAPGTLAQGPFHSVAHETRGTATIHQLPEGRRVLRLTDFATSNGPALHVYLVAATDAKDHATVAKAGHVDLGPLKGNIGDQNYDLPAEVDLAKHQAVTIWCSRFNVNFGTAPLQLAR